MIMKLYWQYLQKQCKIIIFLIVKYFKDTEKYREWALLNVTFKQSIKDKKWRSGFSLPDPWPFSLSRNNYLYGIDVTPP